MKTISKAKYKLLMLLAFAGMQPNLFSQTLNEDWWVPNGKVYSSAIDSLNNILYIGGEFTNLGPYVPYGTVVSASTGVPDMNMVRPNGIVKCAISDGSGGWYIGGEFTKVGNEDRNHVARINSDGSLHNWNPNSNGSINAMVLNGSTLYIGGEFTNVGGLTRNRIAALNTTTGTSTSWNPNANGNVRVIITSGSIVYIGGDFTTVGGVVRRFVAALNSSTGGVTTWNPEISRIGGGGWVGSLAITGTTIYAAGLFNRVDGNRIVRNNIAAFSTSNGGYTSFNPNAQNSINSIVLSGNTLYVGGNFSSIGGQTRLRIAALNTSDGTATSWNPGANSSVEKIQINNGILYLAGGFTTIGGLSRNHIAAFNIQSGSLLSWNPNAGVSVLFGNYGVFALAIDGSNVYLGGSFHSIGGVARSRLAAIDITTGTPTSWNVDVQGSRVSEVLLYDQTLYLGGIFSSIGGQNRNNIAAINLSTGITTSWNPNANGLVQCLAAKDDKIYAGGWFSSIGAQTRNNIASISLIDGVVTAWNPNANNIINTIVIHDNTIFTGGEFTIIGGESRNGIAALDKNTGSAISWNPNASGLTNPYVSSIVISGSIIYVGGQFNSIGGQSRNSIASLDFATGNALPWNPNTPNAAIRSIAISGSTVFVAGSFNNIGGLNRNNLAAIDNITGIVRDWAPDDNEDAYDLKISGNQLFVGSHSNYDEQSKRLFSGYTISETLWQGNLSHDFNHPQNWSFGKADRFPNARIPAGVSNYPHINNDPAQPAIANSLTIDAGANLTIDAGKALTVNGTLTNSGTLSLESDATGTASIIHNTANVPATIGRYMDGGWDEWNSGWHQISSPVSGQAMSAFETSGSGNAYDLYGWDEPSALWKNYKTIDFASWNGGTTDFVPARGYLLSYEQTQTAKSFSGTVHTSDVVLNDLSQSAGSHSGWHLLGNPFASAVKWNDGNWALDNVAGIAKIWNEPASSYVDIAANELIASAQGFMVQATDPDNGLTIPAASRVHCPANVQKSVETTQKLVLQVSDAGGNTAQESCIAIHPEATSHYDTEYDARFLPGYAPLFYTVAGDEMLSTNTQPALESNMVIPVGFVKNAASDYSIILKEQISGLTTYLTDKKTNIVTNLTQTPVYNFSAGDGDDADRFLLHFGTVGMDDPQDSEAIRVYTADGVTYLEGVKAGSEITFTGMTSQTVIWATAKEGLNAIRTGHLSAGVYLIRVVNSGVLSVRKVVIP